MGIDLRARLKPEEENERISFLIKGNKMKFEFIRMTEKDKREYDKLKKQKIKRKMWLCYKDHCEFKEVI